MLKPGDVASDFTLRAVDGQFVSLSETLPCWFFCVTWADCPAASTWHSCASIKTL